MELLTDPSTHLWKWFLKPKLVQFDILGAHELYASRQQNCSEAWSELA